MTPCVRIQWLVGRRDRRGTWAYGLWLVPYVLTAWLFAGEMDFHAGARAYQMLPLIIPVLVVAAQMIYPTLLGWAVIFIPSAVYCCFGLCYLVRNATQRPPQWENDLGGFVLGAFFVGAYLLVCVGLFFARPRRIDAQIADSGASPNRGPTEPFGRSSAGGGPPSVS